MLSRERQSSRMSKITNDGLTRSGTGCGNSGRQRVNLLWFVGNNLSGYTKIILS